MASMRQKLIDDNEDDRNSSTCGTVASTELFDPSSSTHSCADVLKSIHSPKFGYEFEPPPGEGKVITGASINLLMAMTGAGKLTIPYAVKDVGLGLGLVLLVTFACMSFASMHILEVLYQLMEGPDWDYADVVTFLLGPTFGALLLYVIALYGFLAIVGYVQISGKMMSAILSMATTSKTYNWWQEEYVVTAFIAISIILPLSMLKNMDSLKYTSFLGLFLSGFTTVTVIVGSFWLSEGTPSACVPAVRSHYSPSQGTNGTCVLDGSANYLYDDLKECESDLYLDDPAKIYYIAHTSLSMILTTIPLLCFSFNGSFQFLYLRRNAPSANSRKILCCVSAIPLIIAVADYLLIGGFGYFSFCNKTTDNILNCYPSNFTMNNVAKIALTFQLAFASPLYVLVVRNAITDIWRRYKSDFEPPLSVHILVTLMIVSVAYVLAVSITELHIIINLASSISASMIMFVFPGLCYLKSSTIKPRERMKSICSQFILIVGIAVGIGGSINTIHDAIVTLVLGIPKE